MGHSLFRYVKPILGFESCKLKRGGDNRKTPGSSLGSLHSFRNRGSGMAVWLRTEQRLCLLHVSIQVYFLVLAHIRVLLESQPWPVQTLSTWRPWLFCVWWSNQMPSNLFLDAFCMFWLHSSVSYGQC